MKREKKSREETTSLLNGSLITDQWFDSSRRLEAKSSNTVEYVCSKSNREKVYTKKENKQYDYIKLSNATK